MERKEEITNKVKKLEYKYIDVSQERERER